MGGFNSDDHYIYYYGQESLRRNGVAIMVNKSVRNAVLGCNLKNDRMISVCFQAEPFNITVIQVYAPTSNAEEAEVEGFYEDLQDLLELTPQKGRTAGPLKPCAVSPKPTLNRLVSFHLYLLNCISSLTQLSCPGFQLIPLCPVHPHSFSVLNRCYAAGPSRGTALKMSSLLQFTPWSMV